MGDKFLSFRRDQFTGDAAPSPVEDELFGPVRSFTPSVEQALAEQWVRRGTGNAIMNSVAGSGKTTTLFYLMQQMYGYVDYMVFNKRNEVEAQTRLAKLKVEGKLKGNVMAGTCHKFGFGAWRKVAPHVQIEGMGERNAGYYKMDRVFRILRGEEAPIPGPRILTLSGGVPMQFENFVKKLVSYAKQHALGLGGEFIPYSEWTGIVKHYGLDESLADLIGDFSGQSLDESLSSAIEMADAALAVSTSLSAEIIDFEDMIYMPLYHNVRIWQVDFLLGDEVQDWNMARILLAAKMLKKGGRILLVGDRHQSIFGWTGADSAAMDTLKTMFNCVDLNLTVSYRCPQEVVKLAQQWVPHIQPHPEAPIGSVQHIREKEFEMIDKFDQNDAVICRNNAPLITLAYDMIRRGIPCFVEGRSIGEGIIALAKRWKVTKLVALNDKIQAYKTKNVRRLMLSKQESMADLIEDKCNTLLALIEGMPDSSTVIDLQKRIETMFQDTGKGAPRTCLTLSSIHKAKGLEWDRVFLWGRRQFMPSKYARKDWQIQQERNLAYVAVTRAKKELVEVDVVPNGQRNKKKEEAPLL